MSGVIKKNVEDHLFDFVYNMALRDAVMQKAYGGEKKHLGNCVKAKARIKEYIDSILDNNQPDFNTVAEDVEKAFADFHKTQNGAQFTFGNTQKLINMTAKYMFLITYKNKCRQTRGCFRCCHCPVDNIMLGKVVELVEALPKKEKDELSRNLQGFKAEDDSTTKVLAKNWKGVFKEPWSKIKKDRYDTFQAIVKYLADKENVLPIEFDYKYWGQ